MSNDRQAEAEQAALKTAILRLLEERGEGKTICPSEAARDVGGEDEASWRALMGPAREAAWLLAKAGSIEATQKGRVVNARTAKGPIRLRLKTPGKSS